MVVAERLAWDAELPYGTVVLHQNRFDSAKRAWARRRLASCKTLAITVHQANAALRDLRERVRALRRIFGPS